MTVSRICNTNKGKIVLGKSVIRPINNTTVPTPSLQSTTVHYCNKPFQFLSIPPCRIRCQLHSGLSIARKKSTNEFTNESIMLIHRKTNRVRAYTTSTGSAGSTRAHTHHFRFGKTGCLSPIFSAAEKGYCKT